MKLPNSFLPLECPSCVPESHCKCLVVSIHIFHCVSFSNSFPFSQPCQTPKPDSMTMQMAHQHHISLCRRGFLSLRFGIHFFWVRSCNHHPTNAILSMWWCADAMQKFSPVSGEHDKENKWTNPKWNSSFLIGALLHPSETLDHKITKWMQVIAQKNWRWKFNFPTKKGGKRMKSKIFLICFFHITTPEAFSTS